MNPTTSREVGRAALTAFVIAALLVSGLAQLLWQHRRQILDGIARAILATYAAGRICRRQLDAVSNHAAALVDAQPLPGLAPITANLQALREALERWLVRLYPAAAPAATQVSPAGSR
jgi:hypothetical protein